MSSPFSIKRTKDQALQAVVEIMVLYAHTSFILKYTRPSFHLGVNDYRDQ